MFVIFTWSVIVLFSFHYLFVLRSTVFRKFHEKRPRHWPNFSQSEYRWRTGGSKSSSCPCNNVRNLYYSHTHCSDYSFPFTEAMYMWKQRECFCLKTILVCFGGMAVTVPVFVPNRFGTGRSDRYANETLVQNSLSPKHVKNVYLFWLLTHTE